MRRERASLGEPRRGRRGGRGARPCSARTGGPAAVRALRPPRGERLGCAAEPVWAESPSGSSPQAQL